MGAKNTPGANHERGMNLAQLTVIPIDSVLSLRRV